MTVNSDYGFSRKINVPTCVLSGTSTLSRCEVVRSCLKLHHDCLHKIICVTIEFVVFSGSRLKFVWENPRLWENPTLYCGTGKPARPAYLSLPSNLFARLLNTKLRQLLKSRTLKTSKLRRKRRSRMGAFADRARKVAAAAKTATSADAGMEKSLKEETTGIDMEGKSRIPMPDLPKPLTIEEKKFLLAVERGDTATIKKYVFLIPYATIKKLLQKCARHPNFMNRNCVDPMGRGALHMAIDNENLEMVELLVVMGLDTKDSLLHAIDVEFVEAVEVLLEHEEVIHKDGEPYSWEKIDRHTASFTPEITPLILAAHRDNYEILKILLDRGAALPMPHDIRYDGGGGSLPMSHDIRCGCDDCIKSSTEDSLRHSMSRINSYRALASPSLIALSSTDPILTAFELSDELKSLAYEENEFSSEYVVSNKFSSEYVELRKQCRSFAEELLSHTRSSTELAVMLNYDPESLPYEDGDSMKLKRLELAIDYKQKSFVAHPNVQQLLAALWYAGLPGFRRLNVMQKLFQLVKVVVLFPMYCMQYILFPDSPSNKLIRTPFMKFLLHSASYLLFLLLLILFSVRFEELFVFFLGTESMRQNLIESLKKQRGNLPTPIECVILLYVFGFLWEEVKEIHKDGLGKYFRNMWNILDVMRDSLYLSTMLLRIFAYIQQSIEISEDPQTAFIPREQWDGFDAQLISEGLFSAANILSALKLVHIFSINPYLGPLQISLGRMVIDIVKFFFIYTLVLFAFACGLTQLLWYYNDLEKQKCYSLPGGLPDWAKNGDACMKWRRFHNLFEASQSLFWAGFGMVGLDDFELTGVGGYTRFWSMTMFGAYSVINIIVLLNLLIAMMSNSYAFIVDHADAEWKFARTKLWMSYFEEGNTVPPPFNIIPSVKSIKRFFKGHEQRELLRKMSSKTIGRARKARDYRYLAVMRALIWRYVCSLQQRNMEKPVTEDDINEVKGDISALRFELIDLFEANGMDISMCEKKSKAALGRKMRIWERRLMRDFHVSPAMGADDSGTPAAAAPDPSPGDPSAVDRFRRIAKLAMVSKIADVSNGSGPQIGSNQIGRSNLTDDRGKNTLKEAIEKARRKMEEVTPDNSPNSSRGCSPFPELYTGPHLMEAIESLDLSPANSPTPAETPTPKTAWTVQKNRKDGKLWVLRRKLLDKKGGQATDPSKLTIPGRRPENSLKSSAGTSESKIVVPQNVYPTADKTVLADPRKVNEQNQQKMATGFEVKPKPNYSSYGQTPLSDTAASSITKIPPPQQQQLRRPRNSAPMPQYTSTNDLETVDVVRKPKNSL
ncbi:Transient receptor potential channel [Trinorchestia longiramus]|nr:Transient receptor potential channel [Trinorchestia longiramus]